MAKLVVRIWICGVGGKAVADISSEKHTVYVFIVSDCCESLVNDSHQAVQKLSESAAWVWNEKMNKEYAYLFQTRTSRSWEKQERNEYIKDICKLRHQLKQALVLYKKEWQERHDKFCIDFKANRSLSGIADRYKGKLVSFLKIMDQEKTARNNCGTILYRLKNDCPENVDKSDLERSLRQLVQLQIQNLGMLDRKSSHGRGTMLRNDGICRKTDTVKVRLCDRLRRLILPNHMSKLFVLHPKLQTIDGNRQLSVLLAA